jgi:hypothetical protein
MCFQYRTLFTKPIFRYFDIIIDFIYLFILFLKAHNFTISCNPRTCIVTDIFVGPFVELFLKLTFSFASIDSNEKEGISYRIEEKMKIHTQMWEKNTYRWARV